MRSLNILISGAGIAGPALAHWLVRYGHRVTVVERAPGPRPGGQAVDFKGATQLAVLRRMGLLEEVRAHQTGGTDTVMVDARGRERARIPAEFTGGDVEIVRGDLVRILHAATAPHCDYRFGDSLAALREEAGGVRAVFDSGAEHTFDLVVGADGIHSRTRALAFGPEERHVRYLGAHYAIATLPEDGPPLPAPAPAPGGPLVALMRSTPGRTAVYGGTSAMFVFAADPRPPGAPTTPTGGASWPPRSQTPPNPWQTWWSGRCAPTTCSSTPSAACRCPPTRAAASRCWATPRSATPWPGSAPAWP
ncbi:FAD-dependent monooxygenase [Streptomonospora nanhaiensis]|uniref:FAD-dependent monooxygenase n=1 Tax=Streptomonospora nanhaiensis TaxID=1323731 RepID=UPI001C99E163|nr:FAD-dependent monooxygenase [Streptomonospora nanhaiensis]MBX9386801.1 FAD-dependent monooxygenase [Streptomonospora nanhaiensis]